MNKMTAKEVTDQFGRAGSRVIIDEPTSLSFDSSCNLKLSEHFYSIQGEGIRAGRLAYFIRFNLCNLHCQFCETSYSSWDCREPVIINILDLVNAIFEKPVKDVVITGGEPCIWEYELCELTKAIKSKASERNRSAFITIETNGTQYVPNALVDLVSISPKLAFSTRPFLDEKPSNPSWTPEHADDHERLRHQPDQVAQWLTHNYRLGHHKYAADWQLKFVVAERADIIEATAVINDYCKSLVGSLVPDIVDQIRDRTFLMPEAATRKQLENRGLRIVSLCKEFGLNYTDRLQVRIYDMQRGV